MEILSLDREYEEKYNLFILNSKDTTIHYTLLWRDIIKDTFGDEPHYFIMIDKNEEIIATLPTFIKKNNLGSVLNSLPVSGSYGGICIKEEYKEEIEIIYEKLLNHINELAQNNNCLTSTIIVSPFMMNYIDLLKKYFRSDFIYNRFTQIKYLNEEIKYNFKVRNHIRKAIKSGVEVCDEVIEERLIQFYNIYKANMEYLNLNIKPFRFFENMVKNKGGNSFKFYFAYYKDKIISSLLVSKFKNIVTCHETVMNREYKHLQANSLLIDYAIREAKKEGYEIFNFGATESKECGVYKFKNSFGTVDLDYYYLTKIYDKFNILKEKGLDFIKENFKWYYVIPYNIILKNKKTF